MSAPSRRTSPLPRQVVVVVVALALWSLGAVAELWALLAAYAVAWVAVNAMVVWRPRLLDVPLGRWQAIVLVLLVAAAPAMALWRAVPGFVQNEGLLGVQANASDRLRLEDTPSIAPPVVHTDHPQVFYVHAPGAGEVTVRLGPAAARLEATSLGHGVFRVAYDPRRDGAPLRGEREGAAEAVITADGSSASREVTVVRPLAHPRWLRTTADRSRAATASEETDEVVVIDGTGRTARLSVGDGPSDAAFAAPDALVVSHRHDDRLLLVDPRDGRRLGAVSLARFQRRVVVSPEGDVAVVAVDGALPGLFTVSLPSLEQLAFTPLDDAPDGLAYGAVGDTLVVSTRRPAALHRLSREGDGWAPSAEPLLLGRPAVTLARDPVGSEVVVATTDFRSDGEPHLGNHFVQDQLLTVDVATWRVTEQRLTARRSPRQADAGDVDRGVSPMGLDWATDGSSLVAFAGTDEVWRLGPDRATPEVIALDGVPLAAPHGVATLSGGRIAVTSPASGTIAVFRDDGSLAHLERLAPDDETLLRERPAALKRRLGEHVFYEATRTGVSCQSCHLHAHTDGAMHNIGERRLAPTLTVRGVAGTAPYLRDGSFPRVRDLHEGLLEPILRGFLRDAPGRPLTLEAYVESLPRTPTAIGPEARDLERERRGVDAFFRARCDLCHTPPAFTNLGQHPLGTVFPDAELEADAALDTPSLLSVRWTPPYLTDGRAATLREVLREHDGGGRHGDTKALDDEALDDLLYFLETL